jgi:hypothetical protein
MIKSNCTVVRICNATFSNQRVSNGHIQVNRDTTKKSHPLALRPFLPEVNAFAKHNYNRILHPILQFVHLNEDLEWRHALLNHSVGFYP